MVYSLHLTVTTIKDTVTSQVQSLGGCMDVELVTYPDTKLNGVSGDNMLVAALIPRNLRKMERGSDCR